MASVLERPRQTSRSPRRRIPADVGAARRESRLITYLRRALSIFLVVLATCAGGYLVLVGYHQRRAADRGRDPDVGLPRPPGRARRLRAARGLGRALRGDPARRSASVSISRPSTGRGDGLAQGAALDVDQVRAEARDALTAYLKRLFALTLAAPALALGLLVAFAIRSRRPAAALDGRAVGPHRAGDRRGDGRADPAAGGDRQPAVLRPRPGHPARAGGGRRRRSARRARWTRSSTRSSSASPVW